MRAKAVAGLVLAVAWAGCVSPPPPSERASDAARQLSIAARFGDVSTVLDLTAPGMRNTFQKRRESWGKLVRVVDVELASLSLPDADHATVVVDFSWTRVDQGTLRTTRVAQEWASTDGPWLLTRERRVSGDIGLFGESLAALDEATRPNVQFATKVIP